MVHRLRTPLSRTILFLMLLWPLLSAGALQAQEGPPKWQPTGGPGGRLTHLVASPNGKDVYAVSAVSVNRKDDQTQWRDEGVSAFSNALYASQDGGATWQPLTNDLPPGVITALFVDHNEQIWLGLQMRGDLPGRRDGLWTSADRGVTWREAALDRQDLIIVTISEDAEQKLLFGAVDAGGFEQALLYRAASGGATWTGGAISLGASAAPDRLGDLVVHPQKPDVLFALFGSGRVFRSADRGTSWSPVLEAGGGSGPAQLAFLPGESGGAVLVQAGSPAVRVMNSTDDGANWAEVRASGFPSGRLVTRSLLALPRGILLLNTDVGTYRSADGGARWQPLEGALSSGYVHGWAGQVADNVLAATDYGLFASSDAGAVWRAFGAGLPSNSAVAAVLTHKDRPTLLAASLLAPDDADPPELLLTRDSGRTWLPADGGVWSGATAWTIDPSNPDNLFVAGRDYVAVSRDGGFSWKVQPAPPATRTAIAVAASDSLQVYVDGAPQLRTRDGGQTWSELPATTEEGVLETHVGVAVDPADALHLWNGSADGVWESRDGGASWQRAGLDGQAVQWLATAGGAKDRGPLALYAGTDSASIVRRRAASEWQPAASGLPSGTIITAFIADGRTPGLLWAARDGGGVYRSTDGGDTWINVATGMGDNLVLALAVNYQAPGSVFAGTATAGIWKLGPSTPSTGETPAPPSSAATPTGATGGSPSQPGVDARIEVLWPHGFAAIDQAQLANIGIRLFVPSSLQPPACGWRPKVQLWRAVGNEPAEMVETAEQRTVEGQPFPYWEANDVDVSAAQNANEKMYFMVSVDGLETASSVWAHAADARTYFPEQQVPSGVATSDVDAVDARIQIVWPHDRQGAEASVNSAELANIAVTLFKHGTRLSVAPPWSGQVSLYGAWNVEVGRRLRVEPLLQTRQAGVITYPVWEFNDVPVDRARGGNDRLYLWAVATGVKSYPTVWAHGVDSRTFFPAKDEPVQGCLP